MPIGADGARPFPERLPHELNHLVLTGTLLEKPHGARSPRGDARSGVRQSGGTPDSEIFPAQIGAAAELHKSRAGSDRQGQMIARDSSDDYLSKYLPFPDCN